MAISKDDLCRNKFGNMGMEDCRIALEAIKGIFILPKSLEFTSANIASDSAFITAMQTAASATAATSRLFPILKAGSFKNVTDNTADPTEEKAEYFQILGVSYDKHSLTVEMGDVGVHLMQEIFKYRGNSAISFGFYMNDGKVAFRKTSSGGAKGMGGQLIPMQYKQAAAAAIGRMSFKIVLDEVDAFENDSKLLVYPFNEQYILPDLIHGIHDVNLSLVSATTSLITVDVMRKGDFANMCVEYPTIAAAAAVVVKNTATGAAVTPSGVTINALGKLAIAGTFTAGTYSVQLANPTALFATPLFIGTLATGGYESNLLLVTTA
jgi:hypothetical protein